MRKPIFFLGFVFLSLTLPPGSVVASAQGQDDPVLARIIQIGKTDNQTMTWLDVLTNRFGTRIAGSDISNNATAWAVAQFRSWGLQAELQEAGELPLGFAHGPAYGKIIGTPDKYLFFATPAYSAGTRGRVRGPVVVAPADTLQVAAMKARYKGAWVFSSASSQRGTAPVLKLFQDAGALGVVFRGAQMPWRMSNNRVASWDELPTLPEITLLDTQYDEIKAGADAGRTVELEFEIRNSFKMGPVKYYNVIAWLPGTQFPDECVIMSGHLDSVDGSAGATDDGSGSTPAIEALRILAKAGVKPKRTIMTHLFAAEELGIFGSQAWLKQHPNSIPKISVLMNRDYNPGAVIGATVPRSWQADFEKITAPLVNLNPEFPFALTVTDYPGTRALRPSGTDASVFSMQGVPTLRMAEKTDHVYNSTYHTLWDTYDDVLPYAKHQEHTALALAVMSYGIANLDHQLPRADVYLADGIYADMTTAKGRIIAALDHENAPAAVKSFIGMFETPQGAGGRGGRGGGGGGGGPPAGGAQGRGQAAAALPAIGTFDAVDPKAAARMTVTSKEVAAKAVKPMPKEKNTALKHDKAGVFGMMSPTQFYITAARLPSYDGKYVAIGTVVADMKVVGALAKGDAISRISILRVGQKAIDFGTK